LNCIAGFVSPTLGSVEVDGDLITSPGPDRGMVFQNHSLYPWKTVLKNISFGPEITSRGASAPEATARTFLQMVGLSKYENHYPHELSGGMQQRVGIARALANYPRVLLMDEPFGALDSQTRSLMQENLLALWRDLHITVVFVTHDIDEAVLLADRILVMGSNPGHIVRSLDVSLPRPRSSESTLLPEFLSLRKQCLDLIRVETMTTFEK
jgi:NitT/TauT family transport system ATP-binding protein